MTVRPGLYSIYEERIATLPAADLRPVLKSLVLSLLPALEDETSEDFERAFRILESLENKFAPSSDNHESTSERDGYFWQCLFLAVITSSSRRQGALNFLVRKLPKFFTSSSKRTDSDNRGQNGSTTGLSMTAEAVVSPEPGLLIRCFACGLSDSQALIQRGFLDLLVSNLPLGSPLLHSKVRIEDQDRLVSSAAQVLLRREMSLNRRLWSWFLGSDSKGGAGDSNRPSSPIVEKKQSTDVKTDAQLDYFSAYGRKPLERCVLAMFKRSAKSPTQMAQPFRICLSLMDRWEIGGSIIPQIFLPAIDSVYRYSLSASAGDTIEVIRSASLFFDGIEATLIWEKLLKLIRDELTVETEHYNLEMFAWVVRRFNINDEEMLTVHIPYATVYLLSILVDKELSGHSRNRTDTLYDIVAHLLDIVPERAFSKRAKGSVDTNSSISRMPKTADIRKQLDVFYEKSAEGTNANHEPFDGVTWIGMCYRLAASIMCKPQDDVSERRFVRVASLLLLLHSKAARDASMELDDVFATVARKLHALANSDQMLTFSAITSIASLMVALGTAQFAPPVIHKDQMVQLTPPVATQVWQHLSPSSPKYNVEAVKIIWQLQELVGPEGCLETSLMSLVREGLSRESLQASDRIETCRRFAVLWNHTIPASAKVRQGSQRFARKGSAMPVVSDARQALSRQRILTGSLMLVLDELRDPNDLTYDSVRSWLQNLTSLDQVFRIHFESLEDLVRSQSRTKPTGQRTVSRQNAETIRQLEYTVGHFLYILRLANEWVWNILSDFSIATPNKIDGPGAVEVLAEHCTCFLRRNEESSAGLQIKSIEVLEILLSSSLSMPLRDLNLDSRLIDQLMDSLSTDNGEIQGPLLKLISKALQLRVIPETGERQNAGEPRNSITAKRSTTTGIRQSPNSSSISLAPVPPPQLLNVVKMGFSASAARSHLDQWLAFLASILPVYADAIFASIIPLVECLCAELDKSHNSLLSMSRASETSQAFAPEAAAMALLDALDMVLARAHECLADNDSTDANPKSSVQSRSVLSNMTSGVFKSEAQPTRSAQANSRLTVILTFQDAIRVSMKLWIWASHSSETEDFDKASAATTTYSALKLRNRTRYLLEQMFENEPLESIEVLISNWRYSDTAIQASATLDLLHVMQGMRPKMVIPTILDSICSRTNPSALPTQRQSTQTVELSSVDVTTFLFAYLHSIEDDAMDEVWSDCMAFLRDVLSNPLPYRQVLPGLLSVILLLAQKLDNTNFGEQRKMRRELGDVFLRLLAATFTTMPSGYILEPVASEAQESVGNNISHSVVDRKSTSLAAALNEITPNLEVIMETSDRVLSAVNSISNNLISPIVHAKSFPGNANSEVLALFLQIAKRAPSAKPWKKDLLDAFNDPKLLTTTASHMEKAWFPLLHQWCLYDKERMPELLSRLSAPSSAGIMFGVGASAARLDADRKTQLILRRMCILLLCSPEDTFVMHARHIEEKLVELFEASPSSSPSSSIKAELFMLCRAVVLSTSAINLSSIWPIINDNLQSALISLLPNGSSSAVLGNLSLLQACKLLDLLIVVSPDEFQLHEWLYVTDTIDAVYQPSSSWTPSALSDHIAEGLASDEPEDTNGMITQTPITSAASGLRRPLIDNAAISDMEDVKASTREDFARAFIRPFLSQLSLHAYEGVYAMDAPDIGTCRRGLLEDLLEMRTVVE